MSGVTSNTTVRAENAPLGKKRLRVALIQRYVPHYNLAYYRRLIEISAHEWEFIYGEYPGSEESGLSSDAADVLPTKRIRNRNLGRAVWQSGLAHLLKANRYDVVVFELGWQIISNVSLISIAHHYGSAVIPWSKGAAESGKERSSARRIIESLFVRRCDAILAYGAVSAAYFRAYGFPSDKIFIAQNTVDVLRISAEANSNRIIAARLRKDLAIGDSLVVGYFGRLVQQKHVERIIAAFAKLMAAGKEMILVIVGDGPERVPLENLAGMTSCASSIRFIGRVSEAEADAYFQLFDIFVSAFSAGLAVLEAMANANAIVVTPECRPETELIIDGETGIVAASHSEADLAAALSKAAADTQLRNNLGSAAKEMVLAKATIENMASSFDRAVECAAHARDRR
jgi:glycosyltransferase involved in cell wall biosynthesis